MKRVVRLYDLPSMKLSIEELKKENIFKNIFFLLLLSTLSLMALPSSVEKKLCQELIDNNDKDNRCENGSTVELHRYAYLDNNQTLAIFYLDEHAEWGDEYLANKIKVPVTIDAKGRWTVAEINDKYLGIVRRVEEDFAHRLWLVSVHGIESMSCSLAYSRWGGKKWKSVKLPKRDSIPNYNEEIEELCFEKNHLIVTFKGENTKEFWRVPYDSLESKKPQWKKIVHQSTACINTSAPRNHWLKSKKKLFSEEKEFTYRIQVGAFEKLSNVEIVEHKLTKLEDFYFNRKAEFINGKRYTKLFLSHTYKDKKEIKAYLKTLKKRYPNSKTIQNAFVVKTTSDYGNTEL